MILFPASRVRATGFRIFLLALLVGWTSSADRACGEEPAARPLLANGDFSTTAQGADWPDDWPHPQGVSWEKEDNVRFLRLQSSQPGQMVLVYRRAYLPKPLPPAVEIRLRVRYSAVKPGEKSWNDARFMAHFKDHSDRVLKPEPDMPAFHGSSAGWIDKTLLVKVPVGAAYLELMPCLFQPAEGTLDLARCEVFAATKSQWEAAQPKIVPSETIVPSPQKSLPPELHAVGNQLKTTQGKVVWLQGLCVDSLEWSAAGERLDKSIPVAIDGWKANVIRLPVKESFWFGRGLGQKVAEGGVKYRKLVDAVIADANARGAYVAIDLHVFGAPMEEHVEFWNDAATRYKNHPAVLFELFNEPHGIDWKTWRDGGNLKAAGSGHKDRNPAENAVELTGEVSPGMQRLLDAVRATGARNLVVAGGLDWGYDLSGVVSGYALDERPGGNGIIYSSHLYPWKTGWQHNTLDAAARFPIFVGEVGCPESYRDFQFIPPAGRLPLDGWAADVLGLIQKHKLNWTGFSFHPKCGPNAISDWSYTPTPYWGAYVKEALSGKQFDLKNMR